MKEASVHGQQVTDSCFEAYRGTFQKTLSVTDAVLNLVNITQTVRVVSTNATIMHAILTSQLRIPGLAAWKASTGAQQVFTRINQKLAEPLTEEDCADLIHARNEEIGVSVFIGLVIHNTNVLKPDQQKALTQFQSTAQAERVARLLVEQSCPELSQTTEI